MVGICNSNHDNPQKIFFVISSLFFLMKLVKRRVSHMIVCDYCRHRKCNWTERDANDPPSSCLKRTPIEIAERYVGKEEFKRRVNIAKRLASYDESEKTWYLNPNVKNPLTGYELRETMDEEINEWSSNNELTLSELVDYKEEGFERLG